MRSHGHEFAEAAEVCHEEIVSGRFTTTAIRGRRGMWRTPGTSPTKGRMSISKESPDSPRKIDAAVCVIGARMVRRLALAAAPKKVRTGEAFFL
jgi:hypothetical protein